MRLSVVIPVFNEATTIAGVLEAVRSVPIEKEIIIVDDASTDGTREKLAVVENDDDVTVLFHKRNQGKGAALRNGFSYARHEIVIVQDADLEYDPQDYPRFLKPIFDDKADVVYGSRFVGGQSHRVLYFWHFVGNKLLTLLSNMLTNLNLTDMETCYKAFRREVIQRIRLEENRFGFEPEVTAKLAKLPNLRIYEVGITYAGRTYEEGKKIGWRDGVRAIWCLIKYNILK